MSNTLSVLIVEDSESDAELLLRVLKKDGYQIISKRVETAEEMEAALAGQKWSAVISDYSLPQFSGPAALELLKKSGQDIPFIIVSGTIGEETAVAMMKAGVHDYLTKGNLARLLPAIKREIEQAQHRRERKKIEETLYFFAQRGWAESGRDFFEALAEYLGKSLSVDFVFIDRVYGGGTAKTLANYWLGEIDVNFEYSLANTPCENIYANKLCTYPIDTQAQFPKDEILVEMGAQSYSGVPLWDSRGEPVGLIALLKRQPMENVFLIESILQIVAGYTGYEIERREAEDELRQSEARFRALVEHAPDAIVVMDPVTGVFVDANEFACKLFKISRDVLLTKGPAELSPPFQADGRPSVEAAQGVIQKALSGESPRFEWVYVDSQGREVPCEVNLTRLPSSTGWLVRGNITDITERKQAEIQLQEQLNELRRWNNVTVGREERILDLKREVNELLAKAGQPTRYASAALYPDQKRD